MPFYWIRMRPLVPMIRVLVSGGTFLSTIMTEAGAEAVTVLLDGTQLPISPFGLKSGMVAGMVHVTPVWAFTLSLPERAVKVDGWLPFVVIAVLAISAMVLTIRLPRWLPAKRL